MFSKKAKKRYSIGDVMMINPEYIELKRNAKNGCLEAMLDLVDCYEKGKYGIKQDDNMYLKNALQLLDNIDDFRKSQYSTAQIFYEIMYAYLEQGNNVEGEYYHHQLMWEIALDYPSSDLEPYFDKFQVREIAVYLGLDIEDTLIKIKVWHKKYDPKTYSMININHFFTN